MKKDKQHSVKKDEEDKAKKPVRNSRSEYLFTFVIMFLFEQFMYHEWRVYTYYEARTLDEGVFEKSNMPLTAHNLELFTLYRTNMNMSDFARFVEVDVHDQIRDKTVVDPADVDNLSKINQNTVFTRVQLRRYLERYIPERIKWTGIDPVHNDTRERDTHRYYWGSKLSKDFIILTGKSEFTYNEIDGYFKDKVILNYLNELVLKAIALFEKVLIEKAPIKEAYFTDNIPKLAQVSYPFLVKAYRMRKFIDMDSIYFQFADAVANNKTAMFKENLANTTDFRLEYYNPLFEKNYTLEYFRSPKEPYLKWEQDFDLMDVRLNRLARRSPLSQDDGVADKALKYVYEQRNINNTNIMRGFHISVRDYDGNLINDEYGPPDGPWNDSRKTQGKVMWYKPQRYMHPNYTEGDEFHPDFKLTRAWDWEFGNVANKVEAYFQRIKRSNFLPRCLREQFTYRKYLDHEWVRCPAGDQEPVEDDFYKRLGLDKNKDYIFEFMNVW